ncbi:helix-turn-helix transcriptional regulator [Streptomyces longispororuber]|uniref:Helix-turn-helix transcriptional regulator n=1 Tax=Streptomyces longispororuber TaxID=68230 RepID=A0A918ZQN2_9ACTN|nr:helix-turn-helix transcriptional regulator [Streptomyces longispororuber]GHE63657.1 helix-turn-helix transcriptional regulator [Streptomyces longispororuber]
MPYSGLHALLCCAAAEPPTDVLRSGLPPAALLGLLRTLARRGPLLACVDDVHLWDPWSRAALGFAARRLDAPCPVGLVLTVAAHRADDPALGGLPLLWTAPLTDQAAAALLDDLAPTGVDAVVRAELLAEAEGSPRLLHDLVAALCPDQLEGRAPLPYPLVPAEVLRRAHAAYVRALPDGVRALLLLVAAAGETEPRGDVPVEVLLRAAAAGADTDPADLPAAEASGVLSGTGDRVRFVSALLRRCVYAGAPPARRRAAHAALADVLDGAAHRLLRSLHRARATEGTDPALADALAAEAAQPDHGHRRRSAAFARSAELTADRTTRAARLTAAADQARLAGDTRAARALVARARRLPAADEVRGRAELVHGTLALRDGPGADARLILRTAARLLAPHDPAAAAEARLGAAEAAWATGDAAAYRDALTPDPDPGPLGDYRTGMRAFLAGRWSRGRAALRRCIGQADGVTDPALLLRTGAAALVVGDVAAANTANTRALAAAHARGTTLLVPQALEHLAYSELRAGHHARASAHAYQGLSAAHRTGQRNTAAHLHAVLALAASVSGDTDACAEHAATALAHAAAHGLAQAAALASWALARTDLALGRVHEAAARLDPLVHPGPRQGHFAVRMLAVPCYIEAVARTGEPARGRAALSRFTVWTAATADPQAPAQLARCRALLARPEEAGDLYALALAHHDRADGDFERARTDLLYGTWLRRHRHPREARTHLRNALVGFESRGARAWAEQAGAELRAAGDTAGAAAPGSAAALAGLTAQQQRIAHRVAAGATNREVAEQLSVSPRTVDHHLRNVFAALGIRSRVDLARLVNGAGDSEKPRRTVRDDPDLPARHGNSRGPCR